jgi:hypothetical protein
MLSKYNKDEVGLKLPGIYSIPRECGKVYTLDTMLHRIQRQGTPLTAQPEKLSVVEHNSALAARLCSITPVFLSENPSTWARKGIFPSVDHRSL